MVNGMHPQILRRVKSMTETLGMRNLGVKGRKACRRGRLLDIDANGRLVVRAGGCAPMTIS